MPILPISTTLPAIRPVDLMPGGSGPARANNPFQEMFAAAVQQVDQFQQTAAGSAERFLNGENEEVHQVALDAQRAELALDLFLQTRNRVVEAYQEIMRLPL